MDIELNPTSPIPIYQQIRDRIVEAIGTGALKQGDALASVRGLAASFGINPNTVAKAYDLLSSEGFVSAQAKSGMFVACDPTRVSFSEGDVSQWQGALFTLLAEARARGFSDADLDQMIALTRASLMPLATQENLT